MKAKRIGKILKGTVVAGGIAVLLGTTAYAGYSSTGYNTTVGRFNGNGYSGYQT